ncbi:restriction endonuclease subunit S [Rahnella bruchi]|uniref:restriction endonuclease subunit S n=2 Tax=Rahnella bruchi TaxID=1510573 RepID=UPI000EA35BFF|nr:restriction endonuclease subunit S [Rahnella bruchi]
MAKYKAYPEYKDSGVEWLGAIPDHWNILTGKRIFQSVRTPALNNDEQLAASQKYGVIPQSLMMKLNDSKVMLALKGTDSFRHVDENNFVISLRSFEGGIEHSKYSGCVSPAYTVLKNTKPISYNYYRYLLKCAPFIAALQSSTDSLRDGKSINYEQFGALNLPLTSISEQSHIASFLDYETAKIDNLIEKQQQLIELLKEKRQAVISHAVTKGLNPDVPMKDSGVEWLGEVPEHWDVSSLGYYSTLNTGATPDRSNPKYWNGDIAWIKTGEVNYDNISSSEEKITYEAVKNTSVRVSPPGTLLMAMYGQGITRGRVAILDISAAYNQACVAISPSNTLYNAYLRLFFIAGYHAIRDGGNETSQMNLNADIVRKFMVLIPPVSEQKEIVSYLGCNLPQIDTLLERADSVIALLQERRTALISAAVTGKIDVRDWVASDTSHIEVSQEVTA